MNNTPVIFIDFGGVYFNRSIGLIKKYAKVFKVPGKRLEELMIDKNWRKYAEGKMTDADYWNAVRDFCKINDKAAEKFMRTLFNYSRPTKGMPVLIRKLSRKYRVAVLSSINSSWADVLEKKYKISKIFHERHYTFDHGVDKPSKEFFLRAAKKMKVRPEECIVVDDWKDFLTSVKKTGAKTILFKNAKQLETELRKLGVEV